MQQWNVDLTGFDFFPEVYDLFEDEYKQSGILYREFIELQDLGVLVNITEENEKIYGREIFTDYYKVVDHKKWLLARIKHGI